MELSKKSEGSDPVAAVKKKSGQLNNALGKLNVAIRGEKTLSSSKDTHPCRLRYPTHFANKLFEGDPSGNILKRSSTKENEIKRERWLLTRKTWRYMTDAGRKIVPDGYQAELGNNDIFEEQFQQVCLSESNFILWSRRTSYPGANRNYRRRLKPLTRHSSSSHGENKVEPENCYYNDDRIIELLQTCLKLRDVYKTSTLLGTKTVRPDQTSSPSARRPNLGIQNDKDKIISFGTTLQKELICRLKLLSKSFIFAKEENILDFDDVPETILEDKVMLKKIYNALKKQQLHRNLHSNEPLKYCVKRSTSLSSLLKFGLNERKTSGKSDINNKKLIHTNINTLQQSETRQISPSKKHSLYLDLSKDLQSLELPKKCTLNKEKINGNRKSFGTQTSFIQLSELKKLAELYKVQNCKNNLKLLKEFNRQEGLNSPRIGCRKGSIDEDFSQSVSDTIKRYFKMARRKSVHDSESNRFKSINYDKNLRNIKAASEINPPGLNEGLNKAVQTLYAWPLIALDFIKGNESSINLDNAHLEWQKSEDERTLKQFVWEKNQLHTLCSAPTSPTIHSKLDKAIRVSGELFSSSSQFISNILHGHSNSGSHINTLIDQCPDIAWENATVNMQKSKSLSNVGQFVTKKIWRSGSKSQNKRNLSKDCINSSSIKWYPSGNCLWIAESGERFQIVETSLIRLTNTELALLKDFSLEKLKELNIGNIEDLKKPPQINCIPLKKKSVSLFDIGRKEEQNGRMELFGTPLECCLTRDRKQKVNTEDRSKYTLMQVIRGNDSDPRSSLKINENVRSCESLPSKTLEHGYMDISLCLSDTFRLKSKSSKPFTQFKIGNTELNIDRPYQDQLQLMVPMFVNNCIEFLEENGLEQVGLFRVSPSKKRVKQLREELDKDNHFRISVDTCPHDVATLLKEFLRDLPEPLLCYRLYSTFLRTQRIRNRRLQLEALSHIIRLLPIPHRDTLYVLLAFLAKVAAHSDNVCSVDGSYVMGGNKMDCNNLATVFAPNILRGTLVTLSRDKEQENMSDSINVVRTLINHYEEIFTISAELINSIYTQMLEACPEKLYELISTKINGAERNFHQPDEQELSRLSDRVIDTLPYGKRILDKTP
ncbi:uncharacterized protein LOC108102333 isoform X2 [Drosophila eugracilis]|uniref:uncharacterized protein LOC108102333 isoform X2 n=1 Tax=Drosophila eugracilis TaxID=29029 RepID=UPI001BDA55B2|nr:uncharacterized protein LOC108102333 isoform X2 [Drosophila eugracilis]